MRQPNKILVAPLNWGLGHATRCIPIIKELQLQGADVLLASDGRALDLLKQEFPDLPFFELPGYGITYRSKNIILNVGRSFPNLLLSIFRENRMIDKVVQQHQINGVISDNRLGCFSNRIPCVYITHQINLIIPSVFLQWVCRRMNYFFIKKYSECWVPDVGSEPNLSGVLSHGTPINTARFIGALSRMENLQVSQKYDVIAVLSGPEPQRAYLEQAIISQAKKLPYRFLIVQGKTETHGHFMIGENIEVVSSMTSQTLNEAILASDLFIGRTGYSSIMDLVKLGKPALLIPTPGQTEQEYLGNLFSENNVFLIQSQGKLDLKKGMPTALKKRKMGSHFFDSEKMKQALNSFLEKCP